ncbi:benzoate diol dehydrogenase BenD [Roseovarius sp. SYSU LYC5161]|uniref:benzoate diol dehydrogenase BenD n=1 Tax=Roseovarius halophilus (ex Wu et al. 2025) TaxID=3376060 RepID=UPI00399ABD29
MRFSNKTMVVTGAAQGIGRRVAERAAAEGAEVLVVDRARARTEVVKAIKAAGGTAHAVSANLETYAGCKKAIDKALSLWGRIDILVNNVGGTIWAKPFEYYEPAQIDAEISRSLLPTLYGCHLALEPMLAAGRGVIVNVSSIATRGLNRVPYGAAKGGVNALTQNLAWEVAERGIRVVATAPGGTDAPPRITPRIPEEGEAQREEWYQQIIDQTTQSSLMKRYGTLEEQAAPILFLASDEASYLTGVTLPVGGGDLG